MKVVYFARGPRFFTAADSICPGVSEKRVCEASSGMNVARRKRGAELRALALNPMANPSFTEVGIFLFSSMEQFPCGAPDPLTVFPKLVQIVALMYSLGYGLDTCLTSAVFPVVGSTVVTWGYGLGAYMFLAAAVIRIAAGLIMRSVPSLEKPAGAAG